MSNPMIQAEEISKVYRTGVREELPDTAFGAVKRILRAPFQNFRRLRELNTSRVSKENSADLFWALKDVSFAVNEGEVVGIIGRNGAGKSTLLKIFSRITSPSFGQAILNGRVSSLLEVGTGFHPDLTGRENIYMNGTILGMRKQEIDRKFDEIVEFSGVEAFLDTPIKRYSSGMQVRLAFAVAAHLEPEILIIDEVLAVGDGEFQKKCLGKMQDVARGGRTILFVSHNMHAVRSLTHRAALLQKGELVCFGETGETIRTYTSSSTDSDGRQHSLEVYRHGDYGGKETIFTTLEVVRADECDGSLPVIESGQPITLRFGIETSTAIDSSCVTLALSREGETNITTAFTEDQSFHIQLKPGTHTFECDLGSIPLAPGRYFITASHRPSISMLPFDYVTDVPVFDIKIPSIDMAELPWPQRPWGAVQLPGVRWRHID